MTNTTLQKTKLTSQNIESATGTAEAKEPGIAQVSAALKPVLLPTPGKVIASCQSPQE